MLQRILRRRPTPATVIALVALFVALGGPAQAASLINGKRIARGTITGQQIRHHSVPVGDLTTAAARSLRRTPDNSVRSAQIVNGSVLGRDLAPNAVTGAAVADASISGPDLAASSIGAGQLGDGAVTATKLGSGAVGSAAVADGQLQTVDIGSFTGSVMVDFDLFTGSKTCQVAEFTPVAAGGGAPNIADDVVLASPEPGWSDLVVVTGKASADNKIRIVACYVDERGGVTGPQVDPGPTLFRYVTFDAP